MGLVDAFEGLEGELAFAVGKDLLGEEFADLELLALKEDLDDLRQVRVVDGGFLEGQKPDDVKSDDTALGLFKMLHTESLEVVLEVFIDGAANRAVKSTKFLTL